MVLLVMSRTKVVTSQLTTKIKYIYFEVYCKGNDRLADKAAFRPFRQVTLTPKMMMVKMGACTNWSISTFTAVVVDRGSGVGGNAPSRNT